MYLSVNIDTLSEAVNQIEFRIKDIIDELLQNARRAKAKNVKIEYHPNYSIFTIVDDGIGIFRNGVSFQLGKSNWDEYTMLNEEPLGKGLYFLCSLEKGCTIESNGYKVHVAKDHLLGKQPIVVHNTDFFQGTRISFFLNISDCHLDDVIKEIEFYPIPLNFNGELLRMKDFLANAIYIKEWNGIRIGVFSHANSHNINVYGRLGYQYLEPSQSCRENYYYIYLDVLYCPKLKYEYNTFKVKCDAFKEILDAECKKIIYECIKFQGLKNNSHTLKYSAWEEARNLGIKLSEALPVLVNYQDTCKKVTDATILFSHDDSDLHNVIRAFSLHRDSTTDYSFFVYSEKEYLGYEWYNRLPVLHNVDCVITDINDKGEKYTLKPVHDIQCRPEKISMVITLRYLKSVNKSVYGEFYFTPEYPDYKFVDIHLDTDLLIVDHPHGALNDIGIYLIKSSDMSSNVLTDYITEALFDYNSYDDMESAEDEFYHRVKCLVLEFLDSENARNHYEVECAVNNHLLHILDRNKTINITITNRIPTITITDN